MTNYNYSFLIRKDEGTLYLSPVVTKEKLLLVVYFAFLLKFDECIDCIEQIELRDQFKAFIDAMRNGFPSQTVDIFTNPGGIEGNGDGGQGGNDEGGDRNQGDGGGQRGHNMIKRKRKNKFNNHPQQGSYPSKRKEIMNACQVSDIWYSIDCSIFNESGNVFIAKYILKNQTPIALKVVDTFKSDIEEQLELKNEIRVYSYLKENECKFLFKF